MSKAKITELKLVPSTKPKASILQLLNDAKQTAGELDGIAIVSIYKDGGYSTAYVAPDIGTGLNVVGAFEVLKSELIESHRNA